MRDEVSVHRHLKILMVEDSQAMAEYLKTALVAYDRDVEIEIVRDLAEASARLRGSGDQPHAMLVDLILPDAENTESVTVLTDLAPHIPMVVLSGAGSGMEEPAMKAGADDYLAKGPEATPDAIVRMLRRAVVRREVHDMFDQIRKGRKETEAVLSQATAIEETLKKRRPDSWHET